MQHYPDLETLVSQNDEKVVLEVYRSYLSILSDMAVFVIAMIIVIALNLLFPSIRDHLRWLSIVPVVLFLNIFRTYFNDVIHIELHKLTQYHGRLALSYGMPSVRYLDIRALKVRQDILGRIFDYGDLQIGTPGQEGWEITIHGVRAPNELSMLIDELRTWSIEHQEQDDQVPDTTAHHPQSSD